MNILVTGANGQLGNEMRIVSQNSSDNYIFTDITGENTIPLDITDAEAVKSMVSAYDIKAIINCAAYTNVDKAEADSNAAELINSTAVKNLAEAAKGNTAVLIHISTDYVFGGSIGNTPRKEDEPANPTGVYGLTKLHGENEVKNSGCDYLIIRTAWLYSEFGKNFVKTMLSLTNTKPQLKVVFDQVGTPTYALDLANAIFHIVDRRKYIGKTGVYHFSNEGVCSWFDFTKMIAEYEGNEACDIQPCHSNEFPSPVTRPAYSVLDKTKIKETFGISIPYWTDSLKICLKNIKKG